MKYLLGQLPVLVKGLGTRAILLLDYDGTLVPIFQKPELAVLSWDMKELLKSLAKHLKVGIISGRSLTEVKKLVGLTNIYYAGNHGLEIEGPGVRLLRPEAERARPTVAEICERLQGRLGRMKGAIIEEKGLTASIHYRLVRRRELKDLGKIFLEVVKPYIKSGEIRVTHGKKVFEIRPNIDWNKGKAVIWIINVVDPDSKLKPIYIGDDETDEDAFMAIKKIGITILVSEKRKRSHAEFFLRNVSEVKIFLKELAEKNNYE